jgi:uncharacterized membrane protein YeaQ/YmgE (transglycosylase-associated protein family)
MTTLHQPGWYDDPDDASALRYWDGQVWTAHRQRKPTSRPVQPPVVATPPQEYSRPPELPPPAPRLPNVPPTSSDTGVVTKLRTNKLAVYLLGGGFGGLAGALLAELVEIARPRYYIPFLEVILYTALWFGVITSVLTAALVIAAEWYQRRELRPGRVVNAFLFGALAGAIAGAVAEAIFQQKIGNPEFQNYVLRTFCWGLAGSLIGGLLSRTVPNLGLKRGSAAGFVGGAVGGICFLLLVSSTVAETLGRLVGISVLGIALGLAMYVVEQLFREASLEVIWAPNESTRVSLGAQPVTIGGGEDHVFLRGLPEHVAAIVFANGQIEYIETSNGKRTPLKDGSCLPIGPVQLVVHAAE